jgi:hypothetical protein
MFAILKALYGARPAKGARASARQAKPAVEALDERVMLTTVPNLAGVTLNLNGAYDTSRRLQINSETDHGKGNGNGTFQGICWDSNGFAYVSGTITLRHVGTGHPGTLIADPYDFALSYSGSGGSYFGGIEVVNGSGDFKCYSVSSNPDAYSQFVGTNPSYWSYSGSDWEMAVSFQGFYQAFTSHSDSNVQTRQPSPLGPLIGSTSPVPYFYPY